MDEIISFVLVPALYLLGLGAFLPFVPVIAALRGLALVMQVLAGCGRTVVGVVHRRTPEFQTIPPYRPQDEQVKAYRNYFFGPASRDLRQILVLERRSYVTTVGDAFRAVTTRQFTAPGHNRAFTVPYGLALYLGLCVGLVVALPPLAVLLALHALVMALLAGGARLLAGALRAVDRAVLWVKHLRTGMLCPHCFERVPYPGRGAPPAEPRPRHGAALPGGPVLPHRRRGGRGRARGRQHRGVHRMVPAGMRGCAYEGICLGCVAQRPDSLGKCSQK